MASSRNLLLWYTPNLIFSLLYATIYGLIGSLLGVLVGLFLASISVGIGMLLLVVVGDISIHIEKYLVILIGVRAGAIMGMLIGSVKGGKYGFTEQEEGSNWMRRKLKILN